MPEWDPEIEVDAERAAGLIGSQFSELAGADVRRVSAGWDNTIFLVEGRWAFRFPRRAIAVPGVEREIETLRRLAPNLSLPVPVPRWVGAPLGDYPWPWFGAAFLSGAELADTGLPDDERGELAAELGTFLRTLHAPALRSRIGPSLPVDPMRRADMGFRVPATRRRLEQLQDAGLWRPTDGVRRLLDEASGLPPSSRLSVLHGDLHARHVLVDADGRGSGVIDWGDLCVGDPAIDLSLGFAAFEGAARRSLLEAYGAPVDGLSELRARLIAVFLSAALLAYAAEQGNAPLRAEALRGLDRAVSS